jgi:hypothetical protein
MSTPDAFLAAQKRRLVVATWITLISGAPAIWYAIFGAPGKGHEIIYSVLVLVAVIGISFMLLAAIQYFFASVAYPSEARQRLAQVRRTRQVAFPRLEMNRLTAWIMTFASISGIPLYLFGNTQVRNLGASLFGIALGLAGVALVRAGIQDGCIGGRFDVSLDRRPGLFWLTVLWIGLFSVVALIYGVGYLLVSGIKLAGA